MSKYKTLPVRLKAGATYTGPFMLPRHKWRLRDNFYWIMPIGVAVLVTILNQLGLLE